MARVRLGAISIVLSGIFFLLFPVVRPFFDESSVQGAKQFASMQWVVAHALGMAGFILLSLAFLGIHALLQQTRVERRMFRALVLMIIGSGLTLPFFGAEAFSLQIIGQTIVNQNNASLIPLINQIRYGPGIIFVLTGLVLVALATILCASAIWKSNNIPPKWSGVPLAVAFTVYIPQLQGDPSFQIIRIINGLLILSGCIWIALGMLKHRIS